MVYDKSHKRWHMSYLRYNFDERLFFDMIKDIGIESSLKRARLTNSTIELVLDVYGSDEDLHKLKTSLKQFKNIS